MFQQKVLNKITHILKGSYAFNIINDDYKDIIFGIRKDSPLIVGIGENENVLASDIPAIVHITNKYVVLDRDFIVRGFYDGLDTVSLSKMQRDIGLLMLEKDAKKPSTVFQKIIDLSWLWLVVGFLIIIFVLYLVNNKKKNK